jgi:hypothetical protein
MALFREGERKSARLLDIRSEEPSFDVVFLRSYYSEGLDAKLMEFCFVRKICCHKVDFEENERILLRDLFVVAYLSLSIVQFRCFSNVDRK